jgi:hypothetical protein
MYMLLGSDVNVTALPQYLLSSIERLTDQDTIVILHGDDEVENIPVITESDERIAMI